MIWDLSMLSMISLRFAGSNAKCGWRIVSPRWAGWPPRLLNIVARESHRRNSIITDFLAYSRTKQYHFDKVDLVQLVDDTLVLMDHRMTAEKTGIRIERRFAAPFAQVLADGDKIKQVFWNFCENAVRAMKDGGTLTVAVDSGGDDRQVGFTDTGAGRRGEQTEKR